MPRHLWIRHLIGATVHDVMEDPATQIRIHKFFVGFWLANMVLVTACFFLLPGFWQTVSVFYLIVISLYSNLATDHDAVCAAQASLHGTEARDKVTSLESRLRAVESKVEEL